MPIVSVHVTARDRDLTPLVIESHDFIDRALASLTQQSFTTEIEARFMTPEDDDASSASLPALRFKFSGSIFSFDQISAHSLRHQMLQRCVHLLSVRFSVLVKTWRDRKTFYDRNDYYPKTSE